MKKIFWMLGIVIGIGVLCFAYYAISPLFINLSADEALPLNVQVHVETGAPIEKMPEGSTVVGTVGHPASGTARVIVADGKSYVRYENFKTINGPDIYVYLAKDLDAKEFISLGAVRATEGNINYEIPSSVTTADYPYVLTWCKRFGVLFNSARLQ